MPCSRQRVILHLDMDAFYAAVEIRENPALAGKPLIVGHRGRRGVVSTCSYEARRHGVHSAMPSVTAERLCPRAIWLPGRMALYVEVSREIRRILRDESPLVEPLSIDEAFVDLTGIAENLRAGIETARRLKLRIRQEQRLTASVGIAPNKFLAKVASDLDKPDGLTLLSPELLSTRLWPLPVERLWGVGPRTGERLRGNGVSTIADLLRFDAERLAGLLGANLASHLRALAKGEDDRAVVSRTRPKSVSEERTYGTDLTTAGEIDRALLARAEGVARQLRREGLVARTVRIKVRASDFTTWTRSTTLPLPTDLAEPMLEAARRMMLERVGLRGRGVRLLGVAAAGLEPVRHGQSVLFQDPAESLARRRTRAADMVRDRVGEHAVKRARLLGRRKGEASSLPSVD